MISDESIAYGTDDSDAKILTIPQLGEGLRTVRIIKLLKNLGDTVAVDEPVYEIETDKAAVLIESPFAGVLTEWFVAEDTTALVHAPVATIVQTGASAAPEHAQTANAASPTVGAMVDTTPPLIPPRTRAYCRQRGIPDIEIEKIPAEGRILTEADVRSYLTAKESVAPDAPAAYIDIPLTDRQLAINRCALQGNIAQPLPAAVRKTIRWRDVLAAAARASEMHPDLHVTPFQLLAYCSVSAAMSNPKFRSVLINPQTVRRFEHVSIGFAVPLPDDELATAVVHHADKLDLAPFVRKMRSQMRAARKGQSQADDTTSLLLTSLMEYDISDAIPILVPPAVAVLFIGSPHLLNGEEVSTLCLTIDHRLINGIGAASFLAAVVSNVASLS